jgi:predicted KAP-like P-loop ATPase
MNKKFIETISKKTFKDSDSMNLKGFADDLFKTIIIDNLLSENSVVVSLIAKFGMGKSYFLEMFENYLIEEKKAETILINSWRNDFCDEL